MSLAPLHRRYGLFLTCLALSILFSEGWIGPVTCLVTLILPPEIKAFGVSLWSALANIIMPAGNVLFGIYLMVRILFTPTAVSQFQCSWQCPSISQAAKLKADMSFSPAGAHAHPDGSPASALFVSMIHSLAIYALD